MHKQFLEEWDSEKGNTYAYFHVSFHERLDIFATKLNETIIKDHIEKFLIELRDFDLLIFNSFFLNLLNRRLIIIFNGCIFLFFLANKHQIQVQWLLAIYEFFLSFFNWGLINFGRIRSLLVKSRSALFNGFPRQWHVGELQFISVEYLRNYFIVVTLKLISYTVHESKTVF